MKKEHERWALLAFREKGCPSCGPSMSCTGLVCAVLTESSLTPLIGRGSPGEINKTSQQHYHHSLRRTALREAHLRNTIDLSPPSSPWK